jgi:protein required for attachment to host cells
MNQTTYMLVADSGQARLFSATAATGLELVAKLDNPAGRKTKAELQSDRPGIQRSDAGGMHGLGGDKDPHRHASETFARELCARLHQEHLAGHFSALKIAAPPQFLGELRAHLNKECQQVLVQTLDKDLVRMPEKELLSHFAPT